MKAQKDPFFEKWVFQTNRFLAHGRRVTRVLPVLGEGHLPCLGFELRSLGCFPFKGAPIMGHCQAAIGNRDLFDFLLFRMANLLVACSTGK